MQPETPRARRTTSYVVRVWREPREHPGQAGPLRGYMRNLATGEERCLSDPSDILDQLLRDTRDLLPDDLVSASHAPRPDDAGASPDLRGWLRDPPPASASSLTEVDPGPAPFDPLPRSRE